jgi:hypothetical protein
MTGGLVLASGLGLLAVLGIIYTLTAPPSYDPAQGRQAEAESIVDLMLRTHQSYFGEHGEFIPDRQAFLEHAEESWLFQDDLQEYQYDFQIVNHGQGVIAYAWPQDWAFRQFDLRSYSGAVFVITQDGTETTITGICESTIPSQHPPIDITLSEGQPSPTIQCPDASKKL